MSKFYWKGPSGDETSSLAERDWTGWVEGVWGSLRQVLGAGLGWEGLEPAGRGGEGRGGAV